MKSSVPELDASDRSSAHLLARLRLLHARVAAAVAGRRATDPEPDDPFRGLYVTPEAIARLLDDHGRVPEAPAEEAELTAAIEAQADVWEAEGSILRLRRLARIFGLDAVDVELLLVALAPDLDPRFERFYGYLHDDVTRRRASVGLALELAGLRPTSGEARWKLSASGLLVAANLLVVEEEDRPMLGRSLRVPDRVTGHLLGVDTPEPELTQVLDQPPPTAGPGRSEALERALRKGLWPIYLRETSAASGLVTATRSAAALGASIVALDLERLSLATNPLRLADAAIREARLLGAVLVADNLDAMNERPPFLIERLASTAGPIVLIGQRAWDPGWSRAIPVLLEPPTPAGHERVELWQVALASEAGPGSSNGHGAALLDAARAFRLTAPQVERAAQSGRLRALVDDRAIEPGDIQAGARAQNAAGLERLARRIEPRAEWVDLVLPPDVREQLEELAIRARHRDHVLDDWGIGGRSSRGRGITALFAGESGTGKTLAAEVIAHHLGLDLYVIDLSTVIDKYIGETEKNLDRIFAEADRVNGVLLFDEADAIFGKRSEVRDARDRYANVEVAYLLQRMERFDGLAVLTTNLRANLDEAFTRRIDVIVDFPMPETDARAALWRMHLPERLPQAQDLDLEFMARRFRLSGGNIRNICLTAAFLAADAEGPVSMADLIRGTEREYRKLGRLTVEAEFGPYHELLAGSSVQ